MPTRFIEPCLPSPADRPPSGSNWIHEIKHDGYRLMASRDPVGIRLITRRGNDWTTRYPLVVEAVNHLKMRSCLIDGEVVCCDDRGLAVFQALRRRQNEAQAFLYAIDLLDPAIPHGGDLFVETCFFVCRRPDGPDRKQRAEPVARRLLIQMAATNKRLA